MYTACNDLVGRRVGGQDDDGVAPGRVTATDRRNIYRCFCNEKCKKKFFIYVTFSLFKYSFRKCRVGRVGSAMLILSLRVLNLTFWQLQCLQASLDAARWLRVRPPSSTAQPSTDQINQSINQACIFRVVQVIKSLQDPLEVGNNLPGIHDNVRERGLEQKCF